VASRYVRRGRGNSPSPLLAILGIATGVLALTVITAVMNGFQLGFIESILEISSYHARLLDVPPAAAEALAEGLGKTPGLSAAIPFCEFRALIRGRRSSQQGLLVRGLPPEALEHDRGMAAKLEFEAGSFDLGQEGNILLGTELARALTVRLGDTVTLFSVDELFGEGRPGVTSFTVTGIVRSGYDEYDQGLAMMNLRTALEVSGEPLVLGFKLRDRWQDSAAIAALGRSLSGIREWTGGPPRFTSWRDYNRAFFGALRTEKLFMFILVGLIFIVVGLNIFQAQRRAVLERREEIGLLRAVGAGDLAVRLVFVWDGFLIGLAGAGSGLALGLLIAAHISAFFGFVETLVNWCIGALSYLSGSFPGSSGFTVFSPAVFYIKEIPSRIIPREVLLIFMFGFVSALLAAWFASGRVSRTKPAEVLRDE
jgi:lipoprotein-releasing system permease protein